jgi:predicted ester cyclase
MTPRGSAACDQHAANKRAVYSGLIEMCTSANMNDAALALYSDDAVCNAFHPVNELFGRSAIVEGFWQPLRDALPDAERRDSVLIAGDYEGQEIVSMTGHYQGTFVKPLFDIPPTHGVVHLRYSEIHVVQDRRIVQSYVIVDLLDLMRQAGCWSIAPSLGAECLWPGPATCDGVRPDDVNVETGALELVRVRAMHRGLLSFDGKSIESMGQEKHWTKNFMWYGPAGIGTTRGLRGFQAHHQIPFLRAFPDRQGGNHVARVGDGNYVVTGGWPSVRATHSGGGWLGIPATGKPVEMRVMDFYRTDGDLIAENWVPIDIIDVLRQLGVDVFERMRHREGQPRVSL